MRFGCCCPIEESAQAQAAGFDYVECTVVSLQPEADEDVFRPILARYGLSALPVDAFNVFLPRDLKIVGPEVDWDRVANYVETALARVQIVGAPTVVFGSGGARNVPDGFDGGSAQEQLVRFLHIVADAADPLGIKVVIEPLNRKESNVINSVAEAVVLARRVDRPSIRVLADFYHMQEEAEPLAHLWEYRDWIDHVHVADSERLAPGTGSYPYREFVDQLDRAGYAGSVSVECRWRDFDGEAPRAVQFLRDVWQS
jgi:sugar phosphate isomerase/epimerase